VLGTLFSVLAACWLMIANAAAEEAYQVDDAKLASFVVAAKAVHEVVKSSAEKINDVKTDEEAEALRAELDEQFEAAIEGTDGITLAEYKEIHDAATKDEALGKRIMDKLQPATTTQ
jgi:hypothetical protein